MKTVKAKTSGACGNCKTPWEAGTKIAVEKGKPPLCLKCAGLAPKNPKLTALLGGNHPAPPPNPIDNPAPKTLLDEFAMAIAPSLTPTNGDEVWASKVYYMAECMMKERAERAEARRLAAARVALEKEKGE